jgi:hypothetical protein
MAGLGSVIVTVHSEAPLPEVTNDASLLSDKAAWRLAAPVTVVFV